MRKEKLMKNLWTLLLIVLFTSQAWALRVELDDIVVSDADTSETITAVLTLANPATGTLTADSGKGETYTPATGVWTITGNVANINVALAAVAFVPTVGNDQDTTIIVHIRDASGTGPLDGTIVFDVTPINSPPMATNMNQTKKYNEVVDANKESTIKPIIAFSGAHPGQPFIITYADLLAASGAQDADGDPISFRIEEILSGLLRKEPIP